LIRISDLDELAQGTRRKNKAKLKSNLYLKAVNGSLSHLDHKFSSMGEHVETIFKGMEDVASHSKQLEGLSKQVTALTKQGNSSKQSEDASKQLNSRIDELSKQVEAIAQLLKGGNN
jgi:methyl-accepting chemotaxis protein